MWLCIAAAWAGRVDPLEAHGRRLLERGEYAAAWVQLREADCAPGCDDALQAAADGAVEGWLVGEPAQVLARSIGVEELGLDVPQGVRERAVLDLIAAGQTAGLLNDRERLGLSDESIAALIEALPRTPASLVELRPSDALHAELVGGLEGWWGQAVGTHYGVGEWGPVPAEYTVPVRVDVGRCAMLQEWDQDRTPRDRSDVEVRFTGTCDTTRNESVEDDPERGPVTKLTVARAVGGTLLARWHGGSASRPLLVRQTATTIAYQTADEHVILDVEGAERVSREGAWEAMFETSVRLAGAARSKRARELLDEARETGDPDLAAFAWLLEPEGEALSVLAALVEADPEWVRAVLEGQVAERPVGVGVEVPELPAVSLYRGADGRLAGPGLEELGWLERRR